MTVQEKLIKLRKEKHFSDKDVAEILGMKLNSYSRLEHGVGKIGSFLKNKLALLYDKDPDYFVDDPEFEPEKEAEPESISEPEPESEPESISESKLESEPEIIEEVTPEPKIEPEPEITEGNKSTAVITEEIPTASDPEPEIIKEIPAEPDPEPVITEEAATESISIEFQYAGKAVSLSEIIDKAKEACGGKADLYIKPEENRVYYVSGGSAGSFEI